MVHALGLSLEGIRYQSLEGSPPSYELFHSMRLGYKYQQLDLTSCQDQSQMRRCCFIIIPSFVSIHKG